MEKNSCFLFSNFTNFFIIKSAYILARVDFFKQTLSFVYNFCTTCMDRNYISKFFFGLNSSRDLAFLYSYCRFAQRNGARYVISYSFPIHCKDFLKIFDIMEVSAKIKKWIHYWWRYTVTILYTTVMRTCKLFWWIVSSFFPLNPKTAGGKGGGGGRGGGGSIWLPPGKTTLKSPFLLGLISVEIL